MLDFWDLSYRDGSYLEHWDPPEVPPELVEMVGHLGEEETAGRTVLDVGCGAGVEAVHLARRGFRAVGLDSSREALARARDRAAEAGVEVGWCLGSVYDLPLAKGVVDLVLDRGCLHCIDREDRPDYAAEVGRVLAPGGRLLLRGAREDDEEQGLVGIYPAELDRLFPSPRFSRGPLAPVRLEARAGSLHGFMAVITRR